ncbi:MAG: DNA polymerase III subunit gamma/tau [Acidobacteria bacterium]|nr:DNA polymerase III subunit gamma/tau [Acidobacteriota bacterium]
MSYQVIARKWRPQSFEEITGQEAITKTLQNSIKMKRLHHAFIFSGPRGCGKTTTARILAKALNCFEDTTATPCKKCHSCLEIASGSSIDVLEIDAASNTGVDNVRDVIINTVAINPARDRYKIFIIDEVHMLSISAFNALLKTLEEPPPHIIFILATTEIHKLPQTILSRCQHFEFRTIAAEAIASRLRLIADAEKIVINDDALMMIAFAGQGSMRDAQSAFDQVISFAGTEISEEDVRNSLGLINQQTLRDFTLAIANGDQKNLIYLTAKLAETGYDLRQFCRDLMVHFRNLVMLKTVGYDREIVSLLKSELPSYQEQAGRFTTEDLIRFFHLLTALEQEIKISSQPRLHLEIGLIKLGHLTRLQSIEEIIFWLKAVEEKITGDAPSSATKKTNLPALATVTASASLGSLAPSTPSTQSVLPQTINLKAQEPIKESVKESVKEPVKESAKPKTVNKIVEDKSELLASPKPVEAPKSSKTTPKLVPPEKIVGKLPEIEEIEEIGETNLEQNSYPSNILEAIKDGLEKSRKWMLLTALEQGKVELENNVLKVQFDEKAKVYYQTVSNKENKQALIDVVKSLLDKDIKLDVKVGSAKPEEMAIENKQEELRKQAESSPIVQKFLKTFKGEIIGVKEERKK